MGFTDAVPGPSGSYAAPVSAWPTARVFAGPAARATGAIAGGVLAVALLAGSVRVLPLLLAPGVPVGLAPVLGRGVLAVALEAALFVAPPIGFAIAASRLVDRGEARALFAAGLSPVGVVLRAWPLAIAVLMAAALAAGAWGREARAPGRAVRDLLAEARAACAAAKPPAAAEVPLLGVSWVCVEGAEPRAIGAAPVQPSADRRAHKNGVFAASAIALSDDLSRLDARDLELVLPGVADGAEARLRVGSASIRGLSPIARASNLSAIARALILALSAVTLASLAATTALSRGLSGRVGAAILGASGPAASLLVFSSLERAPASTSTMASYALVPAAGIAAIAASAALARFVKARRFA